MICEPITFPCQEVALQQVMIHAVREVHVPGNLMIVFVIKHVVFMVIAAEIST